MRTVIVESPSVWRETVGVIRVVLHVVFWSMAIMLAPTVGATTTASNLAVDEVAFASLDAGAQATYRRALESLSTAEAQRARTGQWQPLPGWRMLHDGLVTDYVDGDYAIVIWEPDPGMAPDPLAVVDEQHHKLPDGTLLHVSVWRGTKPLDKPASTPAFEDGWRRITQL